MSEDDDLLQRLQHLELEKETLERALESRQSISFVSGLLASRYELSPEEAWALQVRVSMNLNVKLQRVSEVLYSVWVGELAAEDAELAVKIDQQLPPL